MANKNIIDDDSRMQAMDARVEKYLRNEMDVHEEEQFINDMKTDSELANRAKAMAVLIKGIQQVGRRRDDMIIQDVKDEKRKRENKHTKVIAWPVRIVAIAAMVLVLVGVTDFLMLRQRTLGLANEYMAYAPQTQVDEGALKGGEQDNTIMPELMPVFEEINTGKNLQHHIDLLSNLFEQAASQQVNKYTDFADYIGYNLAIAHLKNNDKDRACKVLKDLLKIYPNYQIAKDLLDKIEGIKGLW